MLGLKLRTGKQVAVLKYGKQLHANIGDRCVQHAAQQGSQQRTADCAAAGAQEATVGLAQAMLGEAQMPCKLGLAVTLSSKRRGTAKACSEAVADA